MAAANTDLVTEVGNPGTATTLSAPGYTIGDASITVASTTNWPTATGVIFAIDRAELVDGVETRVTGTYNEFVGTVASATSITGLSKLYGTAQNYSAGSLTRVYIPVASQKENRLVTWATAEHTQLGVHRLTSNSTLTSSKVITDLSDTNGNELLKVTATGSAVNELTLANAATGNAPTLSATGGDTNINLNISAKGTGRVVLNGAGAPVNTTVATSEGTASGYPVALATAQAATATIGTSGAALVILHCQGANSAAGGQGWLMGFAVSGATTVAANQTDAIGKPSTDVANAYTRIAGSILVTGLTAGSNTFTAQFGQLGGGTATFAARKISVIPL